MPDSQQEQKQICNVAKALKNFKKLFELAGKKLGFNQKYLAFEVEIIKRPCGTCSDVLDISSGEGRTSNNTVILEDLPKCKCEFLRSSMLYY